jgi:hypothetical protein
MADDGSNDWMERRRKDGSIETVLNKEHMERSRQRIDAGERDEAAGGIGPQSE